MTYAVLDVELLGFIGWNCPHCGLRNQRVVERGQSDWMECKPPPESPKGSCAGVILAPQEVACTKCRRRFRAIATRPSAD